MRASACSYVISPAALTAARSRTRRASPDQRSAVWLLALAARLVRDVGHAADRSGARAAPAVHVRPRRRGPVRERRGPGRLRGRAVGRGDALDRPVPRRGRAARPDAPRPRGHPPERARARRPPRPSRRLDMPHPFRIEETVEIEATPEEVWEALTIGEQLDGWWIGAPNEVEPRLGGKVRQSFGGEVSESTITAWDPPHRFADEGTPGPDGVVHALEFTIEGRSGPRPCASCTAGSSATTGSPSTRPSPRATRCTSTSWPSTSASSAAGRSPSSSTSSPDIADRGSGDGDPPRRAGPRRRRRGGRRGPARAGRASARRGLGGLRVGDHASACAPTTRSTGSRSSRWVAASTSATTSTATTSTSRPPRRPGRRGWNGPSRRRGGARRLTRARRTAERGGRRRDAETRSDPGDRPRGRLTFGVGAPGGTRTHDLQVRNLVLYPLSYGRTRRCAWRRGRDSNPRSRLPHSAV